MRANYMGHHMCIWTSQHCAPAVLSLGGLYAYMPTIIQLNVSLNQGFQVVTQPSVPLSGGLW